ncbi:tectonin beta-propeller repeat-containing protein 2-like [Nematostella vectensis]|uniref:tectonin beta-propeller repeat-containing protein 2-like n=1 Tax=Nematostella vectensis TaxID=45351 RepID=UPI002076ED52|nr:tectonin beta-propeller repeat-containing protein 2-like [Nematostella vectensis]
MADIVIGKDVILQEFEALHELLRVLPSRAQLGPKSFVGQVRDVKAHGMKYLLSSLKEKAHDNLRSFPINFTCFDVSHDAVLLGCNLGIVFFYDRNNNKLSKLPPQSGHDPVTGIKLLALKHCVAVGFANGIILIYSYQLTAAQGLTKHDCMHVLGAHSSPVTCMEWSPDGELLYSGDTDGRIIMTVVNVPGGVTQSVLLFVENAPVVQLSYSPQALLVSTWRHTVLWHFTGDQQIQVGQKERKSPGRFGACFYPPAKLLEDPDSPTLTIYAARPGLRLWTANLEGNVSATLMYKGLMSENPPGIQTLIHTPFPAQSKTTSASMQFGPLQIFHGQFILTWDKQRMCLLDTSPCAVACYHSQFQGDILDVCAVGHEIFVLQQSGSRLIRKFSLIPKLPNPLVKVDQILEQSLKQNEDQKGILPLSSQTEACKEDTPDNETTTDASNADLPSSHCETRAPVAIEPVLTDDKTKNLTVLAAKIQNVVEEDYGELVFRKKKKKKKSKPATSNLDVATVPNCVNKNVSDNITEEISDISSELDSGSKSEPNSGDEEGGSCGPSLREIECTDSGETKSERLLEVELGLKESLADTSHKLSENASEKCQSTESSARKVSLDPSLNNLERQDKKNQSVKDKNQSMAIDDGSCNQTVSLQDECSTTTGPITDMLPGHNSVNVDSIDGPPSLDLSHEHCQPVLGLNKMPYDGYKSPPPIYSDIPLNISDMSFSEVESSHHLIKTDLRSPTELSMDPPTEGQSDSEETPPICLDKDGAEELPETSSWTSSPRTLSEAESSSMEVYRSRDDSRSSQRSTHSKSSQSSARSFQLLSDSWSDCHGPGHGTVISLAVSDTHLWCVTNYEQIFYCPTRFEVLSWTRLDGDAKMIAVNTSGDVIWLIDKKNYAYARKGITDSNLIGRDWIPVEKSMRYIALEESAVLGIKMNGDVFLRSGVNKATPDGKSWRTIRISTEYVQASCFDGLVWFLDKKGSIQVYRDKQNTDVDENWSTLEGITARWVCLNIEGMAWIIDAKGLLWFSCDVSCDNPTGSQWYQVSLGQYLMYDASLLETIWSWVRRGDETKLVTASPKAGLWLLGSNGSLNASRGHLMGSYWESVTPQGLAKSVFWSYVSARAYSSTTQKGYVWALQPNGELVCFNPESKTIAVDPPRGCAVLKLVAASSKTVWGISHNFRVVQLGGVSEASPQGIGWVRLQLDIFQIGRVCHISSGTLCTWAVEETGKVWLRIGGEEDSDPKISQVWLQVDGEPLSNCRFVKVSVSPDDAVVWALDDRFNVYARRNVTPDFPVGTSWEVVPGVGIREVSISGGYVVWALCTNGDVACRYGVSGTNFLGDYWKKVPGNFELISVTPDDELWAIDQNGQLFCRRTQHFYGTQSPFKPRSNSGLFPGEEEWELI